MNDPLVRRHMPLATGVFDEAACASFVEGKERIWAERGYGPWALYVDGVFVGWGGLQPEGEDVDLGLVLHPRHWGKAHPIYELIIRKAFDEMGLESLTILLPPSRKRLSAIARLGFTPDGETEYAGHRFLRFRLHAPKYWVLFYQVVPDYANRRRPFRPEHLELARAAQASGELVLGGALADPVDQALLVFRSNRERVEEFVRKDPYVRNGLVTSWVIRPWTVVVGTALPAIRERATSG